MLKHHQRRDSILRAPRTFWRVMLQGRYDFVYDLMPVNIRGLSAAKRINLLLSGVGGAFSGGFSTIRPNAIASIS